MKFSVARSELSESLTVAARGLSARSTLPILSGILISCAEGRVTFQTSDLEVSVKTHVAGLVEEPGQTVIPGRLFAEIVRNLPEAAVTVAVEREMAVVSCGNASFTLKTLSPDDFPKFPEVHVDAWVKLPSQVVSSVVRQVARAVSRDETRAILTGILLSVEGPMMKMVATDSYRLAVRETVLEQASSENIEVVIPGKALEEVVKLVQGVDEVSLGVAENQIVFEMGETTFVTRRIEGTYPNYRQLIPKECETTVRVATDEMQAAVKRVSLLAQHNASIRLAVQVDDQTLSLSAATQDVGDASEDLMAKTTGQDVEIAFNHSFLNDGLAAIQSEEMVVEITSPLKPGVLKPADEEGFLYLLMPVRLG